MAAAGVDFLLGHHGCGRREQLVRDLAIDNRLLQLLRLRPQLVHHRVKPEQRPKLLGLPRTQPPPRPPTSHPDLACLRTWGSGFRVQGSGFRVQGSGFRVQGSGFRVQGSGVRG